MDSEHDRLIVRTLRASDGPRLACIDEQITGRNRQVWYEGKLRRALEGSDVKVSLGAEWNGLLVGAVLGSVHYGEFGLPQPIAILDTILVDQGYWNRGIATALLEQLFSNLQALGISRLRTEVAWNEHVLNGFLGERGFLPAPRLVLEKKLGAD
jgi:GNAT superfamily N-acetyltransferase